MDIKVFKQRCFARSLITPGADPKSLAKLIGVSVRQLRRYYDVDDTTMPTVAQMAIICETFNVSMDTLMFPERFPDELGATATGDMREALSAINHYLALLVVKEDLDVVGCTSLFAKLYGSTPREMMGTNMFKDWTHYGEDNYAWMPEDTTHRRKSIVEILMALAKDQGTSSQMTWFMSPNGKLRRVLMRCFHINEIYLFIDLPVDDASDAYMGAAGVNEDGEFCVAVDGSCRTTIDAQVLGNYMAGWDIGRIAESLNWPREKVVEVLEQYRATTCTTDFEQMREVIWEWVSDEKRYDPVATIRSDGCVLK